VPHVSTRHEVIPSARRLIKSLRDLGYDFAAAVADLVDNSIAARATIVTIDVDFGGDNSSVHISDNGTGMTAGELKEAMRYGAERDYDENDLGKFGLGLKTASLSQCQRLSVVSRVNTQRADLAAYCWDLEHIEKTNRWEILSLQRNQLGPKTRKALKDTTGTVVIWHRLDRILGYQHPYGEFARKRLLTMCRELEEHLAMVFHRFLAGEVPRKALKILINGNPVQPWDPYCRKELNSKRLTPINIPIAQDGVKGDIRLEPFVLPQQEMFSSSAAFARASGPAKWNRQQGFYIYRNNRMIQSGGWCKLRTVDEHTKLARVALSFSPKLDEVFKINVAKMRVQLPAQIREPVEQAVAPVIRIARTTYSKGGKRESKQDGKASSHSTAEMGTRDNGLGTFEGSLQSQSQLPTAKLWLLEELEERLKGVASSAEQTVLSKIFGRLRKTLHSLS